MVGFEEYSVEMKLQLAEGVIEYRGAVIETLDAKVARLEKQLNEFSITGRCETCLYKLVQEKINSKPGTEEEKASWGLGKFLPDF